jgi:glycerate dehydrogenase
MFKKIVFLDAYTLNPNEIDLNIFSDFGEFKYYDRTSSEQVLNRIGDAEIVLTNKTVLNEATLKQLPMLKYIGVTATGYNCVDISAAKKMGIRVCNAAGYSTMSVAQQTMAMILAFSNRLAEHESPQKWAGQPDFCYYENSIEELQGKTLGLIGFGEIAQKVAEMAQTFGLKIIFTKTTPLQNPPKGTEQVDFDTLLKRADFLSLHCPLTAENKEILNEIAFTKMKKTAVLINTARGPLINESDLRRALDSGQIAGAYLDVLSVEPPSATHVLFGAKNLKLSPHIAWASLAARKRLIRICYDNLNNFLEGKPSNVIV